MSLKYKALYKDSSLSFYHFNYQKEATNPSWHHHDYLTISLLLNGNIVEHTNQYTRIAKPCTVFIKPPGAPHANVYLDDCTIISFNIFDWDYYQLDFEEIALQSIPNALPFFIKFIQSSQKKEALEDLKALVNHQTNTEKPAPDWLNAVRQIIETHYHEPIQIKDLAKEVGKHPGHLARTFKVYFKEDIKTYLQNVRLHQALSRMIQHQDSLTQIGYDCGFFDQSHFIRTFRKQTQLPPKEIKRLFQ